MNESEDIAAYIATLKAGEGLSEAAIRDGYSRFQAEKEAAELAGIAGNMASSPRPCKPSWMASCSA